MLRAPKLVLALLAAGCAAHVADPRLLEAIGSHDHDQVAALLEDGANPNLPTPEGATPLILAVFGEDLEAARVLLAHGADPNQGASADARSPLFYTADPDMIDLLLAHGANLEHRSLYGQTPLLQAVFFGNTLAARHLIASGSDPTAKDARGLDSLDYARRLGDEPLIQLLLGFEGAP